MMRSFFFSMLLSAAVFAGENQAPVLVISPIAGASQGAATGGALVGLYREEGRLRYGLTALGTGGASRWAGASLDARWSFLEARVTPYLGAGVGAFAIQTNGLDQGIQPSLAFETGLDVGRFFAGGRMLLPLGTHTAGVAAHDTGGVGSPALLAQIGFAL
jgi:hypothetical protein